MKVKIDIGKPTPDGIKSVLEWISQCPYKLKDLEIDGDTKFGRTSDY